jgi:hypothetical protein
MSRIDEIMSQAEPAGFRSRYRSEPGMIGHYPWTYADQRRRKYDRQECEYENLFTEDQVRDLIAAAIADARSEGATEAQKRIFPCCGGSDESPAEHTMDCETRALPTGPRQAVRLTKDEVRRIGDATMYAGNIYARVRAIETAVLAANGLGDGNG